jgi:hypothetical protein
MLRYFVSGVQLRVLLDGGFAHSDVPALLDATPNLQYVVAWRKMRR